MLCGCGFQVVGGACLIADNKKERVPEAHSRLCDQEFEADIRPHPDKIKG
jgi:hypothetical protein